MDVTSLLNANSIAAEQRKVEEKSDASDSKSSSRSRTPWDAGGYSLPINTVSSTPNTPPQSRQQSRDDSHTDIPTSPRHQFSDSRSSLSSFTSSVHSSATHSRFSSMSTVGSAHPLSSLHETLSPTCGLKLQGLDLSSFQTEDGQTSGFGQLRDSLSPTGSLKTLALVTEHKVTREQSMAQPIIEMPTLSLPMEQESPNDERKRKPGPRPSSPSDAILIKRTTLPTLRLQTGDQELSQFAAQMKLPDRHYLSAPLENNIQSLTARGHKRALSAPDFFASDAFSMAAQPSMGPTGEPTPPTSNHPDRNSPTSAMNFPAPDTPPAVPEVEDYSIVCMYIPDCDTGSQPRKAISHIFGRNKMCTRLIPQHVWVHYCRKHYQRSRYRNPKEYAKLQCDLVQQQIRRVHDWSLNNAKNGNAGVVQDWGLAVRKREQKRLDDLGGSRKRNAATFDQDDDEGDNDRGNPVPATAVPTWLLEMCRTGYSTQSILEIFNRLHTDILSDVLPCFPDIEILPNIIVDTDEPKSPKGYTKRVPSGHKRAQSLGVSVKSDYYSSQRRMSQPVVQWGLEDTAYQSPIEKRRRPNEMGMANSPVIAPFSSQRTSNVEGSRRIPSLPHRPSFPNISEHQGSEDGYFYSHGQYQQPPLPAPTPQRLTTQSIAHLETTNESQYPLRRPRHSRSQSDMSSFTRGRVGYSPAPSSMYSHESISQASRAGSERNYEQQQQHAPHQFRRESMSSVYHDPRQARHGPVFTHQRVQSTPMMIPETYVPAPHMTGIREAGGHSQSLNHAYSHHHANPHVMESHHARALYSSRH